LCSVRYFFDCITHPWSWPRRLSQFKSRIPDMYASTVSTSPLVYIMSDLPLNQLGSRFPKSCIFTGIHLLLLQRHPHLTESVSWKRASWAVFSATWFETTSKAGGVVCTVHRNTRLNVCLIQFSLFSLNASRRACQAPVYCTSQLRRAWVSLAAFFPFAFLPDLN
jgi:hypothetical protein